MVTGRIRKSMQMIIASIALVVLTCSYSWCAVSFDEGTINAQLQEAAANGATTEELEEMASLLILAAIDAQVLANEGEYADTDALNQAVLDALGSLNIDGLDTADLVSAGNHGLGLQIDTQLEAYETAAAGGGQGQGQNQGLGVGAGGQGNGNGNAWGPGGQGNGNGNAYGPGGNPNNGSQT